MTITFASISEAKIVRLTIEKSHHSQFQSLGQDYIIFA